jgi:hypothetical protein
MAILVNNDNSVKTILKDKEGEVITTAHPELSLYDSEGELVGGQTFPSIMGHLGSGEYEGELSAELDLIEGDLYTLVIEADTIKGKHFEECIHRAKKKSC